MLMKTGSKMEEFKMTYNFKPKGVCSTNISVDINDDGIVEKVKFTGGCSGNTQGVSRLAEGMKVEDVIAKLENIDCRGRGTSCPDQLAKALKEAVGK